MTAPMTDAVVVGAGIGGLRTALDLAEAGRRVVLVDTAFHVGGLLGLLDIQYPNDHCGLCRMLPMTGREPDTEFCLKRGFIHPRITFLGGTRVLDVQGTPGRMKIEVQTRPRGVNPDRCLACGACLAACPVGLPDPFQAGVGLKKAIAPPAALWAGTAPVIDFSACTQCGACAAVCPTAAIDLKGSDETRSIEARVVVWAAGPGLYDPFNVDFYGRGQNPDVLTSLQYERLVSDGGPHAGMDVEGPIKPSDGRPASRVAWVACVGSRNPMIGADYCSQACCLFALKEARLTRRRWNRRVETTFFYMDIRTHGRDFQRYRDEAENEDGVRQVRCRVHSLDPGGEPGKTRLYWVDPAGRLEHEDFDLVVLAAGQALGHPIPEWAGQDGVVVLESARRLTDAAETLIAAGTASAQAENLLRQASGGPAGVEDEKRAATPGSGADRLPRILVAAPWDLITAEGPLPEPERIKARSGVIGTIPLALPIDREALAEAVRQAEATHLLLAGFRPLWETTTRNDLAVRLGLPADALERVDLTPAFRTEPHHRARAALFEIETGLERLMARAPGEAHAEDTAPGRAATPAALVVGGGPAGLAASHTLATFGVRVVLVEKQNRLGGNLFQYRSPSLRAEAMALAADVEHHPGVTVHLESHVVKTTGRPGYFRTLVAGPGGRETWVNHAVVVLATGGGLRETTAYGLGSHPRLVKTAELEDHLAQAGGPAGELVLIQCAGSREEPNNYCSRICCAAALDAASRILENHGPARITVLYRDIMTYGDLERLYTEAREQGVLFIPFDPAKPPKVDTSGERPIVAFYDPILAEQRNIEADWVSLSTGLEPNPAADLARMFSIPLTRDGFYQEADPKWRPLDGGLEGVFLAGLGRGPARMNEAAAQGRAAAIRALRLLQPGRIAQPGIVAQVHPSRCTACGSCAAVCPYGARYFEADKPYALVDSAACQGCGACAAACPNGASSLTEAESGTLYAIEAALR